MSFTTYEVLVKFKAVTRTEYTEKQHRDKIELMNNLIRRAVEDSPEMLCTNPQITFTHVMGENHE